MLKNITLLSLFLSAAMQAGATPPPSPAALAAANYAVATYHDAVLDSLRKMVSYNTVADPVVAFARDPHFLGFKQYVKDEAARLGFDFTDYGYVLVIGMGSGSERLGVVTHGDVQPVNPAKWAQSPFLLDSHSEPGKLLGRGTEDDKGPIATALYAMKAIKDQHLVLRKRIELYVYLAEESDWDHLIAFLKEHAPPQMNITLDAEYPVVTAEKGYGTVSLTVPPQTTSVPAGEPSLSTFGGGFFGSQIPEDANASIEQATPALEAQIRQRAGVQKGMRYQFAWTGARLTIHALGVSAHSSKPEDGVNAISMLADALNVRPWANTTAGALVNFLNDMIGTGLYGEKFGGIAYRDAFMGPMSFAPTVIKQDGAGLQLNINLRRPQGKSTAQLSAEITAALAQWQAHRVALSEVKLDIGEPWVQQDAPQVPVLLSVFSHFTGIQDAQPISIGGGTNSRLFPHVVSFGPGMPHMVYTGHSEHEFISEKQLLLNLEMYTAALVELAK